MARHAALETFGRSGNPVFGDKFNQSQGFVGSERMTLDGTVNKTGILLGLCFFGAIISWNIPNPFLMVGGALVGFCLAIYTSFVPRNAGITAPIYAFVKGLFLGGISLVLEMQFPGIAIQAIGLTFGTLASLLFVCLAEALTLPRLKNINNEIAASNPKIMEFIKFPFNDDTTASAKQLNFVMCFFF